jgi:hypothetical protein
MLLAEVRYGDGLSGLVRGQARSLAQLGLELFEAQCRVVRGGDVPRFGAGRDERSPAPVIGSTPTMRTTRWSRMAWIGKSVTIVRANSLNTSESCSSLAMTPWSAKSVRQGTREVPAGSQILPLARSCE